MTRERARGGILIFGNITQKPFVNNLLPVVRAFERLASCRVVEPRRYDGFEVTGGARPAPIPSAAVTDGLDGFDPDLIVCLGGGLSLTPEDRRRVRKDAVLVGIALSDPLGLEASLEIAPTFDLFYTQDPQTIPAYRDAGIDVRRCDLAVDPDLVHPVEASPDVDVVFYGKWTPYRNDIVARLARRFTVRVHAYPREDRWSVPTAPPLQSSEELSVGIARGRIALELALLDRAPEPYAGRYRITPRVFFAAACAVPTLIERFDLLSEFFLPGEEVAVFDGPDDIVAVAERLLADDEGRRALGARARERVVRDHTWERRARDILADVRGLAG